MNMVVDVGNTFTKVGFFENELLNGKKQFQIAGEIQNYLKNIAADNLIISSVTGNEETIASWSRAKRKIILNHITPLPIQNRYASPSTLGVDRIASACGAWSLFPSENCLVIDVGTCINYEFVNHLGEYLGGAISPGVKIRFDAMHQYTSGLPVAPPIDNAPLTGDSTITSLQSGVMNGVLEEIKGVIDRYQIQNPGIRVILCGGDAHFFENDLNPSIFVAPDLVLMGLNSILLHNVNS